MSYKIIFAYFIDTMIVYLQFIHFFVQFLNFTLQSLELLKRSLFLALANEFPIAESRNTCVIYCSTYQISLNIRIAYLYPVLGLVDRRSEKSTGFPTICLPLNLLNASLALMCNCSTQELSGSS